MHKFEDMNRDELSLLLYFETAAVDYAGKIDPRRMNDTDMKIAKQWNEDGFVRFGRIAAKDINFDLSHWSVLSEDAWAQAHGARRARAARLEAKIDVHRNGYDD